MIDDGEFYHSFVLAQLNLYGLIGLGKVNRVGYQFIQQLGNQFRNPKYFNTATIIAPVDLQLELVIGFLIISIRIMDLN